jgi:DNA-directed RNA polymerase subunit beta
LSAERVIVSQLQRSPGVFFDQNLHPNGTKIFLARIIPFRGSWVDFTTDIYDCIYAIIDRRRKFPASILLRSIGFSLNGDIFRAFDLMKTINLSKKKEIIGETVVDDIVNNETGEIVVEGNTTLNESLVKLLEKSGVFHHCILKY